MKPFIIALSIVTVTLGTALAQTDPNAPTGPYNPNPPAQLTGSQAPPPCNLAANGASEGSGTASPTASAEQPQVGKAGQQVGAANGKPVAPAGCAGQDRPAGGSTPGPANPSHP